MVVLHRGKLLLQGRDLSGETFLLFHIALEVIGYLSGILRCQFSGGSYCLGHETTFPRRMNILLGWTTCA
ncbi:hypothetical protein KJK32_46390 (plasmid) [Streptomyces sp. JCM17656]|nr:hypothetical protein KJK32_46390 [Streptomyces sp. JCM17656]